MSSFSSQLLNFRKQQKLLYFLVFTLAAVMIWVAGSLISSQKRSGIDPTLLELAKPLSPTINTEVLDRIGKKRSFRPEELNNFPILRVNRAQRGEEPTITTFDARSEPVQLKVEVSPPPTRQPVPSPINSPATTPSPTTVTTPVPAPASATEL